MKQLPLTTAFKSFIGICVFGALLSVYLLVHHLEHRLGISSGKSFCSINEFFDCDKVAASSYSELYGMPVAGFGLFFYLTNLLMLRLLKDRSEDPQTWSLLKLSSLLGIIPTVILACISVIIIKSVCIVCFATYICTLALAALSFRLNAASDNFLLDGSRCFFKLVSKNQALLVGILFIGVISLLAPALVINRYHQDVPSLELSNDTRAIDQWVSGKIYPESQILVSDGPDRDVSFGPESSPLTVISYSDMACPHCKVITALLHKMSKKYSFKLVFKDYPLDMHCNPEIKKSFHDFSCGAAKIDRCALLTSPELYTEVHEALYGLEVLSADTLKPVSDLVKGSSSAAADCMNSPEYPKSIARHMEEGTAMKIPGTPAVFINGKLVTIPTPSAVQKILKIALAVD